MTEEQRFLREAARDFLSGQCPPTRVREAEARGDGFLPALWSEVAALGWPGMLVPEALGGLGGSIEDVAILCEEGGRAMLPAPLWETGGMAASALLALPESAERDSLLRGIADGSVRFGLALGAEPSWEGWDGAAFRLDEEGQLAGTAHFASWARSASHLLCAFRSRDAVGLAFVPMEEAVTTPIETLSSFDLSSLSLEDCVVPENLRLSGDAARLALHVGEVLLGAWMVGGCDAAVTLTTEYAKSRVAFGRPIGAFQAIQHKLVQMLNDTDGARWAVAEALWRLRRGDDAERASALAKALASDAYRRVCFEAHEVHAGVAFFVDYDLQLHYRRAKWLEQALGGPEHHKERYAAALGLAS